MAATSNRWPLASTIAKCSREFHGAPSPSMTRRAAGRSASRMSKGAGSVSVSRVAMVDGGVVGGRAGVAHGAPVLVCGLRRPHDRELGLAGLGAAVGLLALAALDLGLACRHAGAVEAEVQGGGIARLGFDDTHFVGGDLAPERLGVAFHRLRRDGEAGEFAQQGARALEAGPGRGDADHAQRRRRQEAVLHAQRAIARAEAVVTMIAVVPGALQRQGAQRGGGLVPAPGEARLAAALAGQVGSPLVRAVGVEPPSDGLPHDLQRHTSGFNLNHLEVDVIERTMISRSTSVSISCAIAEWRPPFFPLRPACSRSQIRPLTRPARAPAREAADTLRSGLRLFDGIGTNGAASGLARISVQPGQQPVRAMTLRASARAMAVGFAATVP